MFLYFKINMEIIWNMELKWKKDKLQVSFQMLRDCWRAWLKEHFTHFNINLY